MTVPNTPRSVPQVAFGRHAVTHQPKVILERQHLGNLHEEPADLPGRQARHDIDARRMAPVGAILTQRGSVRLAGDPAKLRIRATSWRSVSGPSLFSTSIRRRRPWLLSSART